MHCSYTVCTQFEIREHTCTCNYHTSVYSFNIILLQLICDHVQLICDHVQLICDHVFPHDALNLSLTTKCTMSALDSCRDLCFSFQSPRSLSQGLVQSPLAQQVGMHLCA